MPPKVIVLGSGLAGLLCAIDLARKASVLVLTKDRVDEANTRYAQGGIAAAVGPGDSPALHLRDTISAGAGLCDPDVVRVLVDEGPARINDLIRLGVPFDRHEGHVALAREGAHSVPRVLHAGGDATGLHVERTLIGAARSTGVDVQERWLATRLMLKDGRVSGVEGLDASTGMKTTHAADTVVLATGGAGQLYAATTNPKVATGDGIALGFTAGALVGDMEFYQFHPTALQAWGAPHFLLSEAMRGEGAVLRSAAGNPFMLRYDSRGELAPRDVVARAISTEMASAGVDHVFLDVSHLPADQVRRRFPTIYVTCLEHGLDITREPIPVAPAAHYLMGGVLTDVWGATSVPGLFACGEVACTGVHGANRLASNSLLEAAVFGHRVARRIADGVDTPYGPRVEEEVLELGASSRRVVATAPDLGIVQKTMSANIGLARDARGLTRAIERLDAWSSARVQSVDRASVELGNLVTVGRLVATAALLRDESRGAHLRTDFPAPSDSWVRHIVFHRSP